MQGFLEVFWGFRGFRLRGFEENNTFLQDAGPPRCVVFGFRASAVFLGPGEFWGLGLRVLDGCWP